MMFEIPEADLASELLNAKDITAGWGGGGWGWGRSFRASGLGFLGLGLRMFRI